MAVCLGATVLFSLLFQWIYLKKVVLDNEVLQLLGGAIFGMAVLGTLAATLLVILRRYRCLYRRPVPSLTRTLLIVITIICAICFVLNGVVALVALWRVVLS